MAAIPANFPSLVTKDNLTVLIVDDDIEQVELLTEFLRLAAGFESLSAGRISQVWEVLTHQHVDVLLLDYRLPDGTGLELLRQLPLHGYSLPVIMVTGQGDEQTAVKAIRQGAIDYIVKSGPHLSGLPALIHKAVRTHQLQRSYEQTMEQIRYQALLLNNMRDAVVVWDLQGKITYWNPAAQILFGSSARDRLGCQVEECYFSAFDPPVRALQPDATIVECERQFTTPAGRVIWVSSRVSVLRDYQDANRVIGAMDVARDITSRKQMEAQIEAAQVQLAQAARMAAIGELATGVAHQINNPLTTIIADAQLLLHALPPDHPARESAEAIEQAGWRTQAVVQQLADLSRPASQEIESLEVNQTIQRALNLVEDNLRSTGAQFDVALQPDLPVLQGSPRQLQDLWINLLLLARDAVLGRESQFVRLSSKIHQNLTSGRLEVIVEVSDNGREIPAELLADLFEPNISRPSIGRGTGMELSLCREIARYHNGEISVQSNAQAGTKFVIKLPVEDRS